jgi:hypothetical protein
MRQSLVVIAIYAAFCLAWIGFAQWIVPTNWSFSDHSASSGQHYLDRWAVFARAVPLAAILHLIVVLYIERIRRKHQALVRDRERLNARVDAALILVSAVFLALTILTGVQSDYEQKLAVWMDVLAGRDPWLNLSASSFNSYGPLFNVLAPLVWISPLANKLLFAFSYLIYVIWLIEDFWLCRRRAALSWRWVTFWLLFPFPWVEIAYLGFFDSLVALSCVAAVHARVKGKDGVSGISLALGILLKYMPVVILPFLALDERRFRVRLFISCIACVVVGLLASFLIWGPSTFTPLIFAATRPPLWSLYPLLESTYSPLQWFWDSPNVEWLEKPLLLTAGTVLLVWYMGRRPEPALAATLAILVTLLFYRVGINNYQIVLFYLISYWAVSEWEQLREHLALVILLGSYFGLLAVIDLAYWLGFGYIYYSTMVVVLFKFVIGSMLVVALAQFSPLRSPTKQLI